MLKKNNPLLYQISKSAKKDLENIFEYTFSEFGIKQAQLYLKSFADIFSQLARSPKIGRLRIEALHEVYSFHHKSHLIFYSIYKNHIRIIRIFNQKQNYIKFILHRQN